MNKKVVFVLLPILLICIAIFILFCCTVIPAIVRAFTYESKYPDENGNQNFSLAVLNEEDVLSDQNESTMMFSGISYDGQTTEISGTLRERDCDIVSANAKLFDGVSTVQATKIETDELSFNIQSEVTSGNFEIFILVDDTLYERIEANCEKEIHLRGIKNKTVLVKIAGEGAKFTFRSVRTY